MIDNVFDLYLLENNDEPSLPYISDEQLRSSDFFINQENSIDNNLSFPINEYSNQNHSSIHSNKLLGKKRLTDNNLNNSLDLDEEENESSLAREQIYFQNNSFIRNQSGTKLIEEKENYYENNETKRKNEIKIEKQTNENKQNEEEKTRAKDKDNFSIILFKHLNDYLKEIINKQLEAKNEKIRAPCYDIFTHNTNSVDIYVMLYIQYENILSLTPKTKEALDELLNDLEIKKIRKKRATPLTKNSKEYNPALKLLSSYKDIEEKEEPNINDIKEKIIERLKKEGLKQFDDNLLYKEDKANINYLLIEKDLKKQKNLQEKNRENIKKNDSLKKIKELKTNLKEHLINFYNLKNEKFKEFIQNKKIIEINKYFMEKKENKQQNVYSLLDTENNGFIRMINEGCKLSKDQKDKVLHLTNYFQNKNLNVKEINNYRKYYMTQKNKSYP